MEHGCTKASSCDRSGSSRRLAPRLAQILNRMNAAHPHSSGCEQTAARSPLVQRSRLWPPKQRLVSASSSLSLIGQQQPLSLPAILGPGVRDKLLGSIFARGRLRPVFSPTAVPSTSVPIWTHLSIGGHSERRHPIDQAVNRGTSMVDKMLPTGEAGYGCKNRKPRCRHNPDHWLGSNHYCYGNVPDCNRDEHYGMPGKSTLNRRIKLLTPGPPARFYEPSWQRSEITVSKTEVVYPCFKHQDSRVIQS